MMALVHYSGGPAVFDIVQWANLGDILARPRAELARVQGSIASTTQPAKPTIEVSQKHAGTVFRSLQRHSSYGETLFDRLVALKVAASQYAMHLVSQERHRIFARLDAVINIDDWHEEDALPELESFKNFLKWIIYSKSFDWSSIGVSNEGNILVAWSRQRLALTANFAVKNKVTWTAVVQTDSGPAHAVGSCSLQHFADQALFYLGSEYGRNKNT
jgi:hypothetical protein